VGALDGVRVVDLGLLVQGPQAAAMLGDLGADVIKVELPMLGDQARWIGVELPEDRRAPYFLANNRGKRSITLDLRRPAGAAVFKRLAATVDVVISNFKPGTLDGWGLGYEVLAALHPGLVYAAGSAFGPIGPDAEREGADLAGQAAGGLISTTGTDDGEPTPIGVTIADHIAAQNMVAGVLAALIARARTGRGQRVEVSLVGGQIYAQAAEYTAYFLNGRQPGRSNRGHPLLPFVYGIFPTANGWLAMVGVPPPQRQAFYETIGRPELNDDPRFAGLFLAPDDKRELFSILSDVFRTRPSAEWIAVLRAAGQRVAPVNDYAAAAADPQVLLNGYIVPAGDPASPTEMMVGAPIRLSDTPMVPAAIAPELGQHTEEVLLELGYSWDDIEQLRADGAC
jgi:crotonobetainyl-CoA:carnitine CoA-transferase CaiB-like acyl-CoA transferase